MNKTPEEIQAYLAKIRKTIAESDAAVESARLRLQETDRLLASQGLTREQVLSFNVTREQKLAVNEELRRRGLPPIEDDEAAFDFNAATAELRQTSSFGAPSPEPADDLAGRQRRFGNLMHQIRL